MNTQSPKKNKVIFISISLLIIAAAIILILYKSINQQEVAFFARSINDASYDCESKIDSKYDDKLVNKHFDNISSRYEADRHQYIIYYRITVQEIEDDVPQLDDYMVKCVVWEKLGYVSEFRAYKP